MHRIITFCIALVFCLCAQAAEVLYLNSPMGSQRLLHADVNQQYFAVQPFVDTQENLAFCGPASMAAILNSLPRERRPISTQLKPFPYFTQDSFFNHQTRTIKSREATLRSGLTLQEINEMLLTFGVRVDRFYGDQMSESAFREVLKSSLAQSDTRLIVNFDRRVLDQKGAGHFSPIAAYDTASDSVLILDVAKFKYPPFWVTVPDLFAAMNTIDPDSGQSRGLIRVRTP